jgi:hypothetical protein
MEHKGVSSKKIPQAISVAAHTNDVDKTGDLPTSDLYMAYNWVKKNTKA